MFGNRRAKRAEKGRNMKKWYESKTNWLNIASISTTVVGAVAQILPSLQGIVDIKTYFVVSAMVGVANIVLRNYFTTTAIE